MAKLSAKSVLTVIKRILLGVACTILSVIVLAIGTVLLLWGNEIRALLSFEMLLERDMQQLSGAVYSMHMPGGFYLDELLKNGGVSSDEELIDFVVKKLAKGIVPLEMTAKDMIGCSSFTAQTPERDQLWGRNYDHRRTNVCIVRTNGGRGRHATITTADLQYVGIPTNRAVDGIMDKILCLAATYVPMDGINDAGVSCGIYSSYQQDLLPIPTDQQTEKPDITSSLLIRVILDYADDLDEAIEIARSYDLHDSANSSFHYMVADASGRSAILEWIVSDGPDNDGTKRELVITYNDADEALGSPAADHDFQCVTNFIVASGYAENNPQRDLTCDRYPVLYETLAATDGIVEDEQAAMELLRTVSRRTLKPTDLTHITVHSAVYNLTDRTVLWVAGEKYDDPAAVFEFGFK